MYIVPIVVSQIGFQRLRENFQDIDAECFFDFSLRCQSKNNVYIRYFTFLFIGGRRTNIVWSLQQQTDATEKHIFYVLEASAFFIAPLSNRLTFMFHATCIYNHPRDRL